MATSNSSDVIFLSWEYLPVSSKHFIIWMHLLLCFGRNASILNYAINQIRKELITNNQLFQNQAYMYQIYFKMRNPGKLAVFQQKLKITMTNGPGHTLYRQSNKVIFTSFQNSQAWFKLKYISSDSWSFVAYFIIIAFGALILPIVPMVITKSTERTQTSKVNPGELVATVHIPSGKNHRWWSVDAILSLVVYGQVRYFATPTGNFLVRIKLIMSTYQGIWSHVMTIIDALTTAEHPRMRLMPTISRHRLQAHNASYMETLVQS